MTRGTHGQVIRDLSRSLEQIKDLSRMNSEAIDLMTHRIRGEEEHARAAHTADAIAHNRAGAMKQSLWSKFLKNSFDPSHAKYVYPTASGPIQV